MKNTSFFIALLCVLSLSSCLNDLDNYKAPDGGISGRILDVETNEPIPLPVQGSTGVIVNLFEQNTTATKSVDFYAKMDGTYENAKVFSGDYKVVVKGPFATPCEEFVSINGDTHCDLKTLPYARVSAAAKVEGNKVKITYKVVPTKNEYVVSEVYGYWNFAPGVDNGNANQVGKISVKETAGTISFDLDKESAYKANMYKIRSNGNRIYLRIGAKVEGNINYSSIMEVTVQS